MRIDQLTHLICKYSSDTQNIENILKKIANIHKKRLISRGQRIPTDVNNNLRKARLAFSRGDIINAVKFYMIAIEKMMVLSIMPKYRHYYKDTVEVSGNFITIKDRSSSAASKARENVSTVAASENIDILKACDNVASTVEGSSVTPEAHSSFDTLEVLDTKHGASRTKHIERNPQTQSELEMVLEERSKRPPVDWDEVGKNRLKEFPSQGELIDVIKQRMKKKGFVDCERLEKKSEQKFLVIVR